ncbi:MAG: sensor histidine kinase [Opitutaceae bacterium]
MLGKSIQSRIQIWHTTLLTCITGGLLIAFYIHEKEILHRAFDNTLMAPITALIPHFAPEPPEHPEGIRGPGGPNQETSRRARNPLGPGPGHRAAFQGETEDERLERQNRAAEGVIKEGLYIAALKNDGSIYYASSNAPEVIPLPADALSEKLRNVALRTVGENRECIHMAPGRASIIIGASMSKLDAQLQQLQWTLLGIGIGIVFFGYIVGRLLVGKSLKPIQSISETATDIAAGDLSKRIDLNETDSELGQLGKVLNETFGKLENAFDQQVRFTADASHELRTPVAVILAKCQFALRRDREPEKYIEALATCETSAQHIRNLTESLLELSKVDSGEFQILKRDSDLKEIGTSSIHMLSTLAEQKQIQLNNELSPAACKVDPDRIHQVAINLISNAIKYTGEGGVVSVKTYSVKNECFLEVKDTGSGIKEADIQNLFDRFYRVNTERSEDRRSTGLGLAISKAIILAHGGDILVSSELGKGSCFTVRLPA